MKEYTPIPLGGAEMIDPDALQNTDFRKHPYHLRGLFEDWVSAVRTEVHASFPAFVARDVSSDAAANVCGFALHYVLTLLLQATYACGMSGQNALCEAAEDGEEYTFSLLATLPAETECDCAAQTDMNRLAEACGISARVLHTAQRLGELARFSLRWELHGAVLALLCHIPRFRVSTFTVYANSSYAPAAAVRNALLWPHDLKA